MKTTIKGFAFAALIMLCGYLVAFVPAPSATTCVNSAYYTSNATYPIWSGKLDTVYGAATDTFKLACGCKPSSITFSNNAYKYSGSPTTTVALYASSNGGNSYFTTPIATYTVSPSSTTVPVTNGFVVGGNPYTNYMWVATNSASSTMAWQGSVTIR